MKTQKAVEKRSRILSAAAQVFAEKGYSEATLTDIAARADTYAGSLYYYFASKDVIVEEVLNIGTTSVSNLVMGRVSMLPPGVSARDRIRIALETHLEKMLLKDEFVVAYYKIIDQVPKDVRARHSALPRAYGRFWSDLFRSAQIAGEIRSDISANMAVLLLIGSTVYALNWFDPAGKYSAVNIADMLAEMSIFGLAPRDKKAVPAKRGSARVEKA